MLWCYLHLRQGTLWQAQTVFPAGGRWLRQPRGAPGGVCPQGHSLCRCTCPYGLCWFLKNTNRTHVRVGINICLVLFLMRGFWIVSILLTAISHDCAPAKFCIFFRGQSFFFFSFLPSTPCRCWLIQQAIKQLVARTGGLLRITQAQIHAFRSDSAVR